MREIERIEKVNTYNSYHRKLSIDLFLFQIRCFQVAIGQYRDKTIFTITRFQRDQLIAGWNLLHAEINFSIIFRTRWLEKNNVLLRWTDDRPRHTSVRMQGCLPSNAR